MILVLDLRGKRWFIAGSVEDVKLDSFDYYYLGEIVEVDQLGELLHDLNDSAAALCAQSELCDIGHSRIETFYQVCEQVRDVILSRVRTRFPVELKSV